MQPPFILKFFLGGGSVRDPPVSGGVQTDPLVRPHPRRAVPPAPHRLGARRQRALLRARPRHLAQHRKVAPHDAELRVHPVLDAVLRAELPHERRGGGVAVARHGGQQVVLELVLHPSPEPLGERAARHRVAGGVHLRRHPIVLVLVEQVLGLMRDGDDGCGEGAGEEDVPDRDGWRQAQRHPQVVEAHRDRLTPEPLRPDRAR
mmetsp:Transcript_5674/g.16977  ORF Transcript_5674/g.16977 Transcript_5674/m.16977 type:complete len:204 (+) Transcript_5674:1-612(+)